MDAAERTEGEPSMRVLSIGARGIPDVEGGAEKNAENIFPIIARTHAVTLVTLKEFTKNRHYMGINLIPIASIRLLGTDKIWYYIASLAIIAWRRPDIIHCQGLNSALFLLFYKMFARRVVVRYGSADYINEKWGPLGRFGFRLCEYQLRFADAVIAVTPSLKDRLIARGVTDRIEVIPNAIDTVDAVPPKDALAAFGLVPGGYVLSVGRVTWQKDYATLIDAYAKAHSLRPDIGKLVIVGGDDGSGYQRKLEEMGVPGVIFTGRLPRTAIAAFYANARLYLNSSLHEGLSNAILEAVSHRAPLVLSDIVENRDLPLDAHHFFCTGDSDHLAALMLEAIDAPQRFRVDLAKFQSWEAIAVRTMALYESIPAAPAAPRAGVECGPDALHPPIRRRARSR